MAPGDSTNYTEEDPNKESNEIYSDAVEEGHVGFKEIGGGICVVEGWSTAGGEGTNRWYHFQAMNRMNKLVIVCMCPQGASNCIHQRYYKNSVLSIADFTWTEEGTKAKVVRFDFLSLGDEDGQAIHRFSVGKGGDTTSIHGRVIVEYEGTYRGDGRWKCVKDSLRCTHINFAKKYLRKGLKEIEDHTDEDEELEQEGIMEDDGIDVGR
ncbi:hypothetical protein EV368DRAFT_68920 [Lentinula lateritia]|nr:hypothetical protein EV368DRAFT_68920 [Lentinula lateritia]